LPTELYWLGLLRDCVFSFAFTTSFSVIGFNPQEQDFRIYI
jgi:hypothetical protein